MESHSGRREVKVTKDIQTPPAKKGRMPGALKGLMFIFISMLGFLGLRLLPSVVAEGWIRTVILVAALGLITASLVAVVRTR
jgi:hypothetical protein